MIIHYSTKQLSSVFKKGFRTLNKMCLNINNLNKNTCLNNA